MKIRLLRQKENKQLEMKKQDNIVCVLLKHMTLFLVRKNIFINDYSSTSEIFLNVGLTDFINIFCRYYFCSGIIPTVLKFIAIIRAQGTINRCQTKGTVGKV